MKIRKTLDSVQNTAKEEQDPWFVFFFGIRGCLRLFAVMLVLLTLAFVGEALHVSQSSEPFIYRLGAAFHFACEFWKLIVFLSVAFSLMASLGAIHRTTSWEQPLKYKYDLWGRRVGVNAEETNSDCRR